MNGYGRSYHEKVEVYFDWGRKIEKIQAQHNDDEIRKVTGRETAKVLISLYYAHIQNDTLTIRNYAQNIKKGWLDC